MESVLDKSVIDTVKMLGKLEEARKHSYETGKTVYAMGNGEHIVWTDGIKSKESLEDFGYWTVSIFEHGNRVCA